MVREFTLPGAGLHASKLRIHGFGACMIAGTPHPLEESFFWRFATVLRDQTGFQIDTRIVSLGGFPTYKAVPHVKRALINAPDYVVIQLGSTDLTVSLNQYLLRLLGRNPRMGAESISRTNSVVGPMAPFERPTSRVLIELAKDLFCRALFVPPMHGREDVYVSSISQALREIVSVGSKPVLLAPFPHGDRVSNYWARRFTNQLAELAKNEGAIFVDSFNGLSDIPLTELLYSDRLHLTRIGHERVARLLADAISGELILQQRKQSIPVVSPSPHPLRPDP